jgi:Uma2 family endonuclease
MVATLRPLTYADLLDMPDDGQRYEIIGGELIVNPAPRRDHQLVVADVTWIVEQFLRMTDWGTAIPHPVDVYLGENDIVQSDLVVIANARLHIYRPEGIVDEPPDLVVEVLSPSTRRTDLVRKMALYARSGVPEFWVFDPDRRTLAVNVLVGNAYVAAPPEADGAVESRIMPGLKIVPAQVFARLD